jgi:hypothetical protein
LRDNNVPQHTQQAALEWACNNPCSTLSPFPLSLLTTSLRAAHASPMQPSSCSSPLDSVCAPVPLWLVTAVPDMLLLVATNRSAGAMRVAACSTEARHTPCIPCMLRPGAQGQDTLHTHSAPCSLQLEVTSTALQHRTAHTTYDVCTAYITKLPMLCSAVAMHVTKLRACASAVPLVGH